MKINHKTRQGAKQGSKLILHLPWLESISVVNSALLKSLLGKVSMMDLLTMVVSEYPIRHPYTLEDFDYQYTILTLEQIAGEKGLDDTDLIIDMLDSINIQIYSHLFREVGLDSDKYRIWKVIPSTNIIIFNKE